MLITLKVHQDYPYYRDKLVKIIRQNLRINDLSPTKSDWEIALSSIIRRCHQSKRVDLDEGEYPFISPLERIVQKSMKMIFKGIVSCPERHRLVTQGKHALAQMLRLLYFDIYEILVNKRKIKRSFYLYNGRVKDLLEYAGYQFVQLPPLCPIIDEIERKFMMNLRVTVS